MDPVNLGQYLEVPMSTLKTYEAVGCNDCGIMMSGFTARQDDCPNCKTCNLKSCSKIARNVHGDLGYIKCSVCTLLPAIKQPSPSLSCDACKVSVCHSCTKVFLPLDIQFLLSALKDRQDIVDMYAILKTHSISKIMEAPEHLPADVNPKIWSTLFSLSQKYLHPEQYVNILHEEHVRDMQATLKASRTIVGSNVEVDDIKDFQKQQLATYQANQATELSNFRERQKTDFATFKLLAAANLVTHKRTHTEAAATEGKSLRALEKFRKRLAKKAAPKKSTVKNVKKSKDSDDAGSSSENDSEDEEASSPKRKRT
jgi:hypothetical protein